MIKARLRPHRCRETRYTAIVLSTKRSSSRYDQRQDIVQLSQCFKMEDEEQQIRDELSRSYLEITEEESFMFENIDSFVALSRENTSVTEVGLYPFGFARGNDEFWDKVGQIVGNLMKLKVITIYFLPCTVDDEEGEARMPDWEKLTRIWSYVQHKISLRSNTDDCDAGVEDIRSLARAIRGNPMISEFSSGIEFTFEMIGPWCSALATLPSLERVTLSLRQPETVYQRLLLNLEPFKELLRSPALRFVRFNDFYFTNELCHATANALERGTLITDISFDFDCSFCDGGRAIVANALKTNATVTSVQFLGDCDEPLCDTLALVLLCNSTLQNLALRLPMEVAGGRWLCLIFLSLGMNSTLKSFSTNIYDEVGDELCAAIRSGLAKNSTLEEFSLYDVLSSDDDSAVSARSALSFLRTNSSLKSLAVSFEQTQRGSYLSAFRLEAVKMMENTFLESLTITDYCSTAIKVEEFFALLSPLQLNTTLKTLCFQSNCFNDICFTVDEANQLVSVLMKNYGLECLSPNIPCAHNLTVKAVLRLNAAGRRYLIKDGSSVSKGVDVLSAVSDEIDCVFLHLLENPSLCDRRTAETSMAGSLRPSANLDESSSTGKRERAPSISDTEPRRRLA
jgi:hypothetical protein